MKPKFYLIIAIFFFSSLAKAQTEVSGHITENTTWTISNSPYLITNDLYVDNGITLTIPAGVVVKFQYQSIDNYKRRLLVNGTLDVQGKGTIIMVEIQIMMVTQHRLRQETGGTLSSQAKQM